MLLTSWKGISVCDALEKDPVGTDTASNNTSIDDDLEYKLVVRFRHLQAGETMDVRVIEVEMI